MKRVEQQWTLEAGAERLLLATPLPEEIDAYDGLDVELRGWRGVKDGKALFLAVNRPQILVPASWSIPFILLLLSIACIAMINKHFWERHYYHISIGLGLLVVVIYAVQLRAYGQQRMFETALEYLKFIALVGSLFVVTGGILIDISGTGKPALNTLILAAGGLLANIVGTTGASVLLIRPFLRINKGRIKPFHVVLFIFIVSNCAGSLTPIGDPPLFLGYLYGVPFHWTIVHLWKAWLLVMALLLAVFFVLDTLDHKKAPPHRNKVKISGAASFICLGVVLLGVFLDNILAHHVSAAFEPYPLGAALMVLAAFVSHRLANPKILSHNEFNFGPLKEVGLLFLGIFATMVPALDYLAANARHLGITSPGQFYFGSGALSSVLDNAPTYLNFLSAAHGLKGLPLSKEQMPIFMAQYPSYLAAISLGSVFFGACTYIGNGPNFMVKAIADSHGAATPSFFKYIFKYTLPILIPIYILVWLIFFHGASA